MSGRLPTSHTYFSQRLRLHYADWGDSQAPAMLLVHGVQDHCHTWDWFAEAFVDDYHVLAPDLRGHGDSEWVRGSSLPSRRLRLRSRSAHPGSGRWHRW
ncbi:MAG: alpha/beta fold hydrolase [bacterium]